MRAEREALPQPGWHRIWDTPPHCEHCVSVVHKPSSQWDVLIAARGTKMVLFQTFHQIQGEKKIKTIVWNCDPKNKICLTQFSTLSHRQWPGVDQTQECAQAARGWGGGVENKPAHTREHTAPSSRIPRMYSDSLALGNPGGPVLEPGIHSFEFHQPRDTHCKSRTSYCKTPSMWADSSQVQVRRGRRHRGPGRGGGPASAQACLGRPSPPCR